MDEDINNQNATLKEQSLEQDRGIIRVWAQFSRRCRDMETWLRLQENCSYMVMA